MSGIDDRGEKSADRCLRNRAANAIIIPALSPRKGVQQYNFHFPSKGETFPLRSSLYADAKAFTLTPGYVCSRTIAVVRADVGVDLLDGSRRGCRAREHIGGNGVCPFREPSPLRTILPRVDIIYHFPVKFPDFQREPSPREQRGGNELWTFIYHKAHPRVKGTLPVNCVGHLYN